jgi:hypothetical protein
VQDSNALTEQFFAANAMVIRYDFVAVRDGGSPSTVTGYQKMRRHGVERLIQQRQSCPQRGIVGP